MSRTSGTRACAVALAAIMAAGLFASSALASPGGPSRFRHDLRRIDARLRMGIESAPAELGEGLSSSETVCGLAEEVEQRGDAEDAAADWSTLSQLVENRDRPAAARVDGALGRSDSGLLDLRERFAGAWSDRSKATKLRAGVALAREGIQMLRAAMGKIAGSFETWPMHECETAAEAIEAGIARLPAAVAQVSAGMRVLWTIAFPVAN